jgi:hypothetical protein
MEIMVNAVVLSTDRAWTRFEIDPGPRRIKDSPCNSKRVKGIEPSCPAWEAGVLPLNYTRKRELPILDFRVLIGNNLLLPGKDVIEAFNIGVAITIYTKQFVLAKGTRQRAGVNPPTRVHFDTAD